MKKSLSELAARITPEWTLFLDRDGVINRLLVNDYVKRPDALEILPGVPETIARLNRLFKYIIVVTNQQGVGKGLMTAADLEEVHNHLRQQVERAGGRLTAIYACTRRSDEPGNCRKPAPHLALRARRDYPDIDFSKSIMVGDQDTDIEFGARLGMVTIWVSDRPGAFTGAHFPDYIIRALRELDALSV